MDTGERNVRITNIMGDPGSGGPLEWWVVTLKITCFVTCIPSSNHHFVQEPCFNFGAINLWIQGCLGPRTTLSRLWHRPPQWRRPGTEFGGTETFSWAKISEWGFFSERNLNFSGQNFWWPFFKSLTRFFGFSLPFPRFSVSFTMFNVVYDPFLTRTTTISEKNSFMTPFFTLFVLSRASENTTSQNIGGTDAWAVPPPQIFGLTVPHSPP